jgi:glyoxylase-like metal-dependent hydrolase (beta-lactamase superfamily II)
MRFAIGEAVVDVIVDDDDFQLPLAGFLPGLDPDGLARHADLFEPEFLDRARDRLRVAIQSYVVRTGGRTILIDSCVGDDRDRPEIPVWNRRHATGFLERLQQAGTDPAAVDLVFCTHLHVDHVGWNTRLADDRFVPTFPNARYLFGRAELADWLAEREAGAIPAPHGRAFEDSVVPILEAGLADLVDDGHELAPGLELIPLPGHTRHQMGARLDHRTGRAVFCGDAMHSPVQIYQPDVSAAVDVDPAAATLTRRALLEEAAESDRLVAPAHFRGRRCVRIRRTGSAFEPRFRREPA